MPLLSPPAACVADGLAPSMMAVRFGLLALLLGAVGPYAVAQPVPSCDALLGTAQAHYVDREFAEAEEATRACLARPDVETDDAVASYRLLALIHLQQDDLVEAKRAVIQLLGLAFDYAPDPVLDPPAYVGLVELLRDQLRVEQPPDVPPPDRVDPDRVDPAADAQGDPPQGALPPLDPGDAWRTWPTRHSARRFHLGLSLGAGSYGGERGINADGLVGEFFENGGVSVALDGSYAFRPSITAAAVYRAVRLPLLLTNDVLAEDVQVRPGDSSAWVHTIALLLRGYVRLQGGVAPFVQAGMVGSVSRLNDELRVGLGPQGGFGLDVTVTQSLAAFAELNFALVVPGDAVDRVDTNGTTGDILTFAGVGLRYGFP